MGSRKLAGEHKRNRLTICQGLLYLYRNKGDAFFRRIVAEDETWIHHYIPESKLESIEWKHLAWPVKKNFKTEPMARKLIMTHFGDTRGPNLEHYQE
jgi:hypothetical protein